MKVLQQKCDGCHEEFLTAVDLCVICYIKKYGHIVRPEKTKWQRRKKMAWGMFLIMPLGWIIGIVFNLSIEIAFLIGMFYGIFYDNLVNLFDRWF